MASMNRAYDARRHRGRHPFSDWDVVLLTLAAVIGVWTRSPLWVGSSAVISFLLTRRAAVLLAFLILGIIGGWRAQANWADAKPRHLGQYSGWATIVGDPAPFGRGLRVTLEIDGQRFDAWTYGSPRRRLIDRQAGERVFVQGRRRLITSNARRAQIRHVVGNLDISVVGDWFDGSPLYRTSSRVRTKLRRVAESTVGGHEAALFTGLVIGDDAREPVAMVEAFRASGLSHLTAVSGENVAFVLAAASPLLRRLRPWWRWAATVGLIGWFMMLTRFEPSVLRAGVMAMLGSSAFVLGRQQSVVRLLACTVTILVLVDPMLVWSVGFWLSAGATAGVCVVAPKLAGWLPGPLWLRVPLSVTLGAQVGVALPSWLVFHRLPLVSLPANLLAVPVAGFVMLFGIPAGLLSAFVPPLAPLLMAPCAIGTRWVATVAYLGAAVEPSQRWSSAGWLLVVVAIVVVLARHRSRRPAEVVPV
ncbi:MAG: competence protein ComEC [Ilumatobacteraceae bacterium]|jgi:competence protein ComEC